MVIWHEADRKSRVSYGYARNTAKISYEIVCCKYSINIQKCNSNKKLVAQFNIHIFLSSFATEKNVTIFQG